MRMYTFLPYKVRGSSGSVSAREGWGKECLDRICVGVQQIPSFSCWVFLRLLLFPVVFHSVFLISTSTSLLVSAGRIAAVSSLS